MECAPTDNVEITHVVAPATSGRLTQAAMFTPPSWNVTVPVGVGPTPVTTAVRVTDWPKTDGFTEDVNVVVEGASALADVVSRTRLAMLTATAKKIRPIGRLTILSRKAGSRLSLLLVDR